MTEEQLVIEQIHKDFDEAWIGLLEKAKENIKENHVQDVDYIEKMYKLGFKSSKPVKEAKVKLETAMKNKEEAEMILHYSQEYPLLKFLTEEKLDEICEKYNLIYAPVERYLGAVPKKNVDDIFAAQKLKTADQREEEWRFAKPDEVEWHSDFKGSKKLKKQILEATYDREPSDRRIREKFPELRTSWIYKGEPETVCQDFKGLFIAAPEKDFNLDGLTRGKTKGFHKTVRSKAPKDPIVFRYVVGGIQVLTKWGLEANDPELANPLDN